MLLLMEEQNFVQVLASAQRLTSTAECRWRAAGWSAAGSNFAQVNAEEGSWGSWASQMSASA